MRHAKCPALQVFVLAAVLALSGCPLGSDFPLSSPAGAALDSSLTGNWTVQDPETGKQGTVVFLPFNDNEYVVESRGSEETDRDAELMRAFVTVIDGVRFLNLQGLEEKGSRSWSFASYSIVGDTMTLRLVDDGLFTSRTFASSDELRRSVQQNLHDPRLYVSDDGKDSFLTLSRVKS